MATREYTRRMSALRRGGVIDVKLAPTLPPTAGARRTTNELEIRMTATTVEKKDIGRMTALLEEKDRPYEIAEETDATDANETDVTDTK